MTTKLGRMVIYLEVLLLKKSRGSWVTWSCEITWQTKSIVCSLQQCLWAPILARWWLTLRGSYLWTHMDLQSHGLARSRDKLKPLYLYYQNGYSQETWQDGDISWGALTHKVIWLSDHVVLQDQVTSLKHHIFTAAVAMATKVGKIVIYLEGLLATKLHISRVTWSCKIMWQTRSIISPLQQCLWPTNLARWWLTLRGSNLYSHMSFKPRGLARSRDKLNRLYLH